MLPWGSIPPCPQNLRVEAEPEFLLDGLPGNSKSLGLFWVAVKELNLSYYIGETLLFTIYTHYGNLI